MPNFGFDDWIDAQLRSVPVPPDLLSRLAENGAAGGAADARVDVILRNVSVPVHLESRLRRIARHRRPSPLWLRTGLAASIFLMLALGAAGYVGLVTGTLGPGVSILAKKTTPEASETKISDVAAAPTEAQRTPQTQPVDANALAAEPANANQRDNQARTAIAGQRPDAQVSRVSLPFVESVALGASFKQAIEAHRRSQAALGAGGDFARLPALDALEAPLPRGMTPPPVPGYDLLFQLKHGEHPFVSPADHKALVTTKVPLTLRTASYDLAVRALETGQMPSAEEIRVEDFLAAQHYALPPVPADDLTLHAAASPSPLGGAGLYLLQLTVQAGAKQDNWHPPTRLIVVVDTSAPMRSGARWEAIQRGLAKLAGHMTPSDRLTLIGFAEQSHVLAENATKDDLRTLLASGTLPAPAGSADLAGAIRSACEAVRTVASSEARRVVFITSGREDFDNVGLTRSGQALEQLAAAKIPWQIVRMAAGEADPQWAELAEQAHGEISAAASAADIHSALARKLTGRFSTVAGSATLKLRFNPGVVSRYRLLGHESATLTGPEERLEIDLGADEMATGMFELWIKPKGDQLAVAELSWRDPASGEPRGKVQPIWRSHIAASFSKAPAWFQQGVIAAKTAEALRGSFFAPASRPFGQILDLAGQIDPGTARQADVQTLVRLMKQAEKRR